MKRILLVEDDPNLGLLLQDYLQLKGKFDVVLCKDGDEGLRVFTKQNFDLLVTGFTGEDLPLEFIARISNARCRVGEYAARKTDCYELMVNTAGKTDLNYLFEQSVYFLNQIKYDSK